MDFNLTLSDGDFSLLWNILGLQPAAKVYPLMVRLQAQVQFQETQQAQKAAAASEATTTVEGVQHG